MKIGAYMLGIQPSQREIKRLVSSAVLQALEMWQRQQWRRNDEMDQREVPRPQDGPVGSRPFAEMRPPNE